MKTYKCLSKGEWCNGDYKIVCIRAQDKDLIRQWRNEQIYHLRQAKQLTEQDQNTYFETTVANLFEQELPNQLLFSYLKNEECIGYGGLVHINWIDKNAEISFIMNTQLETTEFNLHWGKYLNLIEQVGFNELQLHKLTTYAFDLRPHLYTAIETCGYTKEAILKEHCLFNREYKNVIIHSKFNN